MGTTWGGLCIKDRIAISFFYYKTITSKQHLTQTMTLNNYQRVFGSTKPVIGMVHFGALPGAPLYDEAAGIEGLTAAVRADLLALQEAGFDAVMFGNENDRPYELKVDLASTTTMAYVIGQLHSDINVPFGVNVLWDATATIALAAATGAAFVRDIFTGAYTSDMGIWVPDAGAAMRYRNRLGRKDLALLYNVSAEFADSLDRRALPRPSTQRGVFVVARRGAGVRTNYRRSGAASFP